MESPGHLGAHFGEGGGGGGKDGGDAGSAPKPVFAPAGNDKSTPTEGE